jgi:hypothetical protein
MHACLDQGASKGQAELDRCANNLSALQVSFDVLRQQSDQLCSLQYFSGGTQMVVGYSDGGCEGGLCGGGRDLAGTAGNCMSQRE